MPDDLHASRSQHRSYLTADTDCCGILLKIGPLLDFGLGSVANSARPANNKKYSALQK
jgi:hypothetical protein